MIVSLAFLVSFPGAGQQSKPVLVPITLHDPRPGAFGSVWDSELTVHNSSDQLESILFGISPVGLLLYYDIEPQETRVIGLPALCLGESDGVPAYVLYVRGDLSSLSFQSRVFDRSRVPRNYGTEIPVVRGPQLELERIDLLNVPIKDGHRVTLRLYDVESVGSPFDVAIFDQRSGTRLVETTIQATAYICNTLGPTYAEVDLASAFELQPEAILRIRIRPQIPSQLYWAFVTITSNETQQVTTVTPQQGQ